ncbi:hypothetical protein XBO1_2100013 [Xenorhabdus bovienii str. oregonense]|uniref:Uncharacterized protein n=1 Tax=Xenorhabdus bovienii str. oregonense TaxID=1398202 RepID=A0A077P5U7_XENBV|nr:hypothetical protein XBO1_2100013 [Xenorhabdus bovienii str. oregonense]
MLINRLTLEARYQSECLCKHPIGVFRGCNIRSWFYWIVSVWEQ